ncbi:hypothetical protein B0H67DRAFT_562748 [Lasiosphaeris hirsuta]|uniref:Ankyrin repeat protein n=1 Tax=Lasiosphaeris hirsuta TaxID=260670 RepID=A0AA40EB32_9PEZI|nr:hypothetical protein B0H67DRAFT_562748 [Lasiosphaeris hirsuta]
MNIRTYNRREEGDFWGSLGIGRLILRGDIEGTKRTLREGRTSAYDVYGDGMYTAPWIATGRRQQNTVKLLLQAGADPFQKLGCFQSRSVIVIAFQYFMGGSDEIITELMPITTYVEKGEFSPLHLALIGN